MDGHHARPAAHRGLRPSERCPVPTTTPRTAAGSSRHRRARSSWRRRWPPAATSWPPCSARACAGNQDGGHVDALPTYQPPRELGADARYPLALVCPKPHAFMNSQYGNMAKQAPAAGRPVVRDPQRRRRRPGASRPATRVRMFNDRGEILATARVTDDVAPGVVLSPMGQWPGRGRRRASASTRLTSTRYADIGRAPTFSDTAVQVERIEA